MTGWRYRRAVAVLRAGGVVAYPTESVFGLGCDPRSRAGLVRVFAVKRRPRHKRCILIAAGPAPARRHRGRGFAPLCRLRVAVLARSRHTRGAGSRWRARPGSSTGDGTVATRVTSHPVARDLCKAFRGALISTSANRAGCAPVRDVLRARLAFGTEIDWYVPGKTGGLGSPTRIIDVRDGSVIRS